MNTKNWKRLRHIATRKQEQEQEQAILETIGAAEVKPECFCYLFLTSGKHMVW